MDNDKILSAIGSTEETTFNVFCSALKGDCPSEKSEWRDLFQSLNQLERDGLIEISRTDDKIDVMTLTEAGANKVRAELDAKRGLFANI